MIAELSKLHLLPEDISTEQSFELNARSYFERCETHKERRLHNAKVDVSLPAAKERIASASMHHVRQPEHPVAALNRSEAQAVDDGKMCITLDEYFSRYCEQ